MIKKPTGNKIAMLKAEVDILTRCDHPNVVKMYKCYETEKILYLVLELLTGGELFDRIIDTGHFTEVHAAIVMQMIFRAIFYMHENHIMQRGMKPAYFQQQTKDPIREHRPQDHRLRSCGEVQCKPHHRHHD